MKYDSLILFILIFNSIVRMFNKSSGQIFCIRKVKWRVVSTIKRLLSHYGWLSNVHQFEYPSPPLESHLDLYFWNSWTSRSNHFIQKRIDPDNNNDDVLSRVERFLSWWFWTLKTYFSRPVFLIALFFFEAPAKYQEKLISR